MTLFLIRLRGWDVEVPLHCYNTSALARSGDPHPHVDNIYIGVTFTFIASSLLYALVLSLKSQEKLQRNWAKTAAEFSELSGIPESNVHGFQAVAIAAISMSITATDLQYSLLTTAMLQSPLHIYSIFALRASNERYLEQGSSEREWGFGQIAAMVLLAGNLLQIVDCIAGMSRFQGCIRNHH
jgi:hypothetical protein